MAAQLDQDQVMLFRATAVFHAAELRLHAVHFKAVVIFGQIIQGDAQVVLQGDAQVASQGDAQLVTVVRP